MNIKKIKLYRYVNKDSLVFGSHFVNVYYHNMYVLMLL